MKRLSMAATDNKSLSALSLYDKVLMVTIVALLAMGLLMVASSSIVISDRIYHQPFHYLYRQIVFLGVGLSMMMVLLRVNTEFLYRSSPAFLVLGFVLLVLVLIPGLGRTVNGSTRWLNLIVFRLQVSELVKLFLVVYLAGYIYRHIDTLKTDYVSFIKPIILFAVASGLLLLQPDFGAAVVIMATSLGMLFLAGVRLWQYLVLMAIVGAGLMVISVSAPYRLQRLTAFLNPWAVQYDSGYQLTQSLIAFGRGGWFGVGLGESVQKLFYLPEAHTDFLFAVLAEEMGLFGVLLVIILFSIVIYRGFKIARAAFETERLYASFLAYGLTLWLGFQAVVNIGVSSGALPTKGLTLPLMSYGGASLIVTCMVLGILLRIDHENRLEQFCLHSGRHY